MKQPEDADVDESKRLGGSAGLELLFGLDRPSESATPFASWLGRSMVCG